MAAVAVTLNPAIVTAPDGNANELVLAFPDPSGVNVSFAFIKVTAGSFQFCVGSAPTASSPTYGTTDTVPPISFVPGAAGKASNIFFKAASGGNTFNFNL